MNENPYASPHAMPNSKLGPVLSRLLFWTWTFLGVSVLGFELAVLNYADWAESDKVFVICFAFVVWIIAAYPTAKVCEILDR